MADKNGHIDLTPQAMSALTGWPIDLLKQALQELTQPDPESRSDAHEGRRLILIDPTRSWGWKVVNHEKYREKARLTAKTQREVLSGVNAERMADRRRPPETADDPLSNANADSNTNPSKSTTAAEPPAEFDRVQKVYPRRAGDQAWSKGLKACKARISEGHQWDELVAGAERYARFMEATEKIGTQYVKQCCVFFGPEKHFLSAWELPKTKTNGHSLPPELREGYRAD